MNIKFLSLRTLSSLAFLLCVAAFPSQGIGQTYPSKPVKIIVGFTPGGAVDLVARTVGQGITGGLGQPVIVENKPGAGTNIAMRALIDAPADGFCSARD